MARPVEAPLLPALARAAGLAAALLCAGFFLRAPGLALLHRLAPDAHGAVVLVAAGGALTAVGAPRQAVAFAGGLLFGPWVGGALALAAQMLGCVLPFALARGARGARGSWAGRRLNGPEGVGGRVGAVVVAAPFTATLTLRLLPVGSNLLLNLAAGVAGVPAAPFLAGTCVGYLPQTIVFALLGAGTQIGAGGKLAAGVGLFAASAVLGAILWRRQRGPGVTAG